MAQRFDLMVRGGTCVLPGATAIADIAVKDGKIAAIGDLGGASAETEVDAAGLHVLPGLIDSQVHFRDPGSPEAESIEAGCRGAILGGVATVFDMPNTDPAIDSVERVDWKREYVAGKLWSNMAFYVGATKDNIADLADLERQPGVCAIKVFAGSSTGNLLVEDDESIEQVMRSGFRRIAYHSEDEFRLRERRPMLQPGDPYERHAEWRDVECALRCTQRIVALARRTGRRAHILHISTAEEMDFLQHHKDHVTVEVLPNHITHIAPECYDMLGGLAVMNPPVRGREHYDAIWAAVRNGIVDVIASDHAPHPRDAKSRPYPDTPAGMTGVQTIVPVMLDHVSAGRLSLERLVDLMAAGPARTFGLVGKGRLAVGYDGDLTIVDMARRQTITNDWIESVCGWTAFDGMSVAGWPRMTVVGGHVAMREDEIQGTPRGAMARFGDCLAKENV